MSLNARLTTLSEADLHSNEQYFAEQAIVSIPRFFTAGHVVDTHVHSRAQLVYADVGVMELYLQGRY